MRWKLFVHAHDELHWSNFPEQSEINPSHREQEPAVSGTETLPHPYGGPQQVSTVDGHPQQANEKRRRAPDHQVHRDAAVARASAGIQGSSWQGSSEMQSPREIVRGYPESSWYPERSCEPD